MSRFWNSPKVCSLFGWMLLYVLALGCSPKEAANPPATAAESSETSAAAPDDEHQSPEATTTAPSDPPTEAEPPDAAIKPADTSEATSTAAPATATKPATSREAAAVLDLGKLPLFPGTKTSNQKNLANVSYVTEGTVRKVYEFYEQEFTNAKCTILPQAMVTDDYASANFSTQGFIVSLSIFPSEPGKVMVTLANHGNVDLNTLPAPAGVTGMFPSPISSMLICSGSQAEAKHVVRELLLAAGWLPYGEAGDSMFLRQNAILLNATVAAAPAQDGKTVITYSTQLMRKELPVPAEKVTHVQYSDQPLQVGFDAQLTEQEVCNFYRQALATEHWEATTENANAIGFEKFLIFRNPDKDLLELKLRDLDGDTRVMVRYQTAAEVAEEERRAKEALAKKNEERNRPLPQQAISLPDKAQVIETEAKRISFQLPAGTARDAVASLRKSLTDAGWKEMLIANEKLAGSASFTKDDQTISLDFVDTGFMPAEVNITASGVELTLGTEK